MTTRTHDKDSKNNLGRYSPFLCSTFVCIATAVISITEVESDIISAVLGLWSSTTAFLYILRSLNYNKTNQSQYNQNIGDMPIKLCTRMAVSIAASIIARQLLEAGISSTMEAAILTISSLAVRYIYIALIEAYIFSSKQNDGNANNKQQFANKIIFLFSLFGVFALTDYLWPDTPLPTPLLIGVVMIGALLISDLIKKGLDSSGFSNKILQGKLIDQNNAFNFNTYIFSGIAEGIASVLFIATANTKLEVPSIIKTTIAYVSAEVLSAIVTNTLDIGKEKVDEIKYSMPACYLAIGSLTLGIYVMQNNAVEGAIIIWSSVIFFMLTLKNSKSNNCEENLYHNTTHDLPIAFFRGLVTTTITSLLIQQFALSLPEIILIRILIRDAIAVIASLNKIASNDKNTRNDGIKDTLNAVIMTTSIIGIWGCYSLLQLEFPVLQLQGVNPILQSVITTSACILVALIVSDIIKAILDETSISKKLCGKHLSPPLIEKPLYYFKFITSKIVCTLTEQHMMQACNSLGVLYHISKQIAFFTGEAAEGLTKNMLDSILKMLNRNCHSQQQSQ